MVVLLSIAGFVVIWIDRGITPLKWDSIKHNPHSALGMTVICLALVQPVVAFFRPSPNHKYRILFKIIHTSFGYSATITAGVGMYFATKLDEAMLDEHSWIILLALGWFCILSTLTLGIYNWCMEKRLNELYFDKTLYGSYLVYIMVMFGFVFAMFSVILNTSEDV